MSMYKEEFYTNGNSEWNDKNETSNNFIETKNFLVFNQEKTAKNVDKVTSNFSVNNFSNNFCVKTNNMCDLNEPTKNLENSNLIKFESDKICLNNNENNNLDFTTLHSNQEITLTDQILKNQLTENCNQVVNQNFITHPSTSINKNINMSLNKNSTNLSKPQLTVDTQLSSNNVDDGLTNLSWLQNLNMGMTRLGAPTPPASPLCSLTPSYFSVISPLSNSSNNNFSCNQTSQLSTKQNKLIDNNPRKFNKNKNSSKNSSSKAKQGIKKASNKVNNICQSFNSSFNQNHLNQNSQTTCNLNGVIDNSQNNLYNQTNNSKANLVSNSSLDYMDLNNSLDLLYNGEHSMLNSDFCSTLCNEEDVNLTNLNNSTNISNPSYSNTTSKQKLLSNNELSLKNVNNSYAENLNYLDEQVDYKLNGSIKPPYSYATLIGMAMDKNKNKMTLRAIYKWIKENFLYYRNADPSWQNSIRHNLSLNKCFIKIARTKEEPGKGGFWKLDPVYAENFTNGVFKKRKHSQSKNELDLLLNEVPEKKKKRKETKQKKLSSFNPQTMDYSNIQNKSIYHSGDNIVMHDTPPNSAESYSGFVESQTDIETANAINSLDLANKNNLNQMQNNSMHQSQHSQQTSFNDLNNLSSTILKDKSSSNTSQPIINNCSLSISSTQQTRPIHHFRNLDNHLNINPQNSSHHQTLNAQTIQHHHQPIINQQQKSPVNQNQHYMIHVTNTNNQESQITIEPMSNSVQQIDSTSNCTFPNEISQLTSLNSNNEPCLESSSLSLTTMNSNVQENCLLTNDTDICWNALLTDDIRLVDSINTYNVSNSSIQVTNPNSYQVNNSIIDSQQTANLVSDNSNAINLNHSNLILNQIPNSQKINNTNTSYFNSNNNLENFSTHQIVADCNNTLGNNQINAHSNNSQMISTNQNVVSCTNSPNNVVTTNLTQTSSWDNGRNWMTYNHINNQNANNITNNETSNTDLSNVNLTAHDRNCSVSTNTNDNQNVVIQINSNNNCLNNEIQNCNSFYNTNIMPTWIECKVSYESNSFDLDNFSDLDSCSKY